VLVAAVADEEHESLGVQEVLRAARADAAIVTEPTELRLAVAHKGFVWTQVRVSGTAAHGSRPHLGVDAIVKTGPILTAIGALDASLATRRHPLLGRPSVHASVIEGGAERSSYPAACVVGLERRTLPGETVTHVEQELAELLEGCRAADPELRVEQETLLVRDPFETEPDTAIVHVIRDAAQAITGDPPELAGMSYWADSAFIAGAGIPTVLFGPGGEGAHAIEEWVSLPDTAVVARTLARVAERFCA
jgi:acetylornithine deacetylase